MLNHFRIWITGAKGQLGDALYKMIANTTPYAVLTTDLDVDITDLEVVTQFANLNHPDVIINCAAIADFKVCEENHIQAYKVNALGVRNLSIASRCIGAKLIQISTDDVFSIREDNTVTEFDDPRPKTVYGKSKFAGEKFARDHNPKHLIIRSSWLYSDRPNNFVSWVLEKARKRETLHVPNDQIGSPTSANALAKFIIHLLETQEYGVFHASCEGFCSRFYFAKEIIKLSGIKDVEIEAVLSSKDNEIFGQKQNYILLENMMMSLTEIYTMPKWEDSLVEFIKDYNVHV